MNNQVINMSLPTIERNTIFFWISLKPKYSGCHFEGCLSMPEVHRLPVLAIFDLETDRIPNFFLWQSKLAVLKTILGFI